MGDGDGVDGVEETTGSDEMHPEPMARALLASHPSRSGNSIKLLAPILRHLIMDSREGRKRGGGETRDRVKEREKGRTARCPRCWGMATST